MNKTITIYELLGLIKDGKAPERILYGDEYLTFDNVDKDYFSEETESLFIDLFKNTATNYILNDTVEIIEDNDKLEKIKTFYSVSNEIKDDAVRENLCDIVENLKNHEDIVNKIINHINKIEEKLDEEER